MSVFTKNILTITGRNHCGVVDKPLTMLTGDCWFDTGFLQSVGWDQAMARPHLTIAVGGLLNTNKQNQLQISFATHLLAHLSSMWAFVIIGCLSFAVHPSLVWCLPTIYIKQHLLNCLVEFHQTLKGLFLDGPLSKLFKDFNSIQNSGCHGNQKEKL